MGMDGSSGEDGDEERGSCLVVLGECIDVLGRMYDSVVIVALVARSHEVSAVSIGPVASIRDDVRVTCVT